MIDAGLLPVGRDQWDITGPEVLVRIMDYFCEHSTVEGFVDVEEDEGYWSEESDDEAMEESTGPNVSTAT